MFGHLSCDVRSNYSLKNLNTWHVGGSSKYYIVPETTRDIIQVKQICQKYQIPLFVLGRGSNVLIDDEGYPGVILHIGKKLKGYEIRKDSLYAESGVPLQRLSFFLAKEGISGFEFYAGIPGTVGGAVVMNAGCLGYETKTILKSVVYINDEGVLKEEEVEHLDLNFRSSVFLNSSSIIIGAKFKLNYDDPEKIMTKTKKAADIRKKKFPKNVFTAGSTFKSPPLGPHPGKLVEEVGLKGYRIGDAQISPVHGNWIVNHGKATSKDIKDLINLMFETVKNNLGIVMDREVIYV